MSRVCLATYIYGDSYQDYIPFLVYSCNAANPEYDLLLFLHGKLREDIRAQIERIGKKNLYFKENAYDDCPRMNSIKARCLRWTLYDERFLDYDYLYVVDIDMIYMKEPLPLHEQHLIHMKTTGLPYDNIVRHFERKPWRLRSLVRRIKYAGLVSFGRYLLGSRKDYRVTGLHFIAVRDYFAILNAQVCEKYRQMIYNGRFASISLSTDDESFLYQILLREGLRPDDLAVQTEPYKMLDFNNPEREEFRPHHGIHLGIFRQDLPLEGKRKKMLDSEVYTYYAKEFKDKYAKDPMFWTLLEMSSEGIQKQFDNLFRYYGIHKNN